MLDVHTPHTRHTSHTSGLKVFVRKLVHVLIVLCLLLSPSLLLLPLLPLLSLLYSGATRLFFTAGDVCECGYLTSACYTCPTQSRNLQDWQVINKLAHKLLQEDIPTQYHA